MLIVSKTGTGNFQSISKALTALEKHPEYPKTIHIQSGIYKERVIIRTPGITLIGENPANTIITEGFYAAMTMPDNSKRGTFRSYTMFVDADDVTLKNLTIENSAGDGRTVGQAIALYADGDKLSVHNCRMLGHQDTLFTGPLPPKEREQGGFTGPKEFSPRIVGRQYYKDCYIEGDVDFIFGSARAYFEHCQIHSLSRNETVNGYITAPSTPKNEPFGYVFHQCHFTSDCLKHSVYLGRPWREYAQTVLVRCEIENHIFPEGWHDWDRPDDHKTVFFAECACTGPGAVTSHRPDWTHILTQSQAEHYRKELVLGYEPF